MGVKWCSKSAFALNWCVVAFLWCLVVFMFLQNDAEKQQLWAFLSVGYVA
jgi:hypothetical protein